MNENSITRDAAWAAIVAEAASWIALLHGPDRTSAAERGLKRWLADDPLHAKAFELATETWTEARAFVKNGTKIKLIVPGDREAPGRTWQPIVAAAAATIAVVLGAVLALIFSRESGVATGVGERRTLALEDGTQVSLNTATVVRVDYTHDKRLVHLEAGEALFDVARQVVRPFVVDVGDRSVTALGTAFLIRRDRARTSVTLIDGRVTVEGGLAPALGIRGLQPGERLTFSSNEQPPKLDRPELDKLVAWQTGKVDIEDLTLAEAALEMNRYSTLKIDIEGEAAESLRVSGIFRIGDSRNFANAVARTHGLEFREEGRRRIVLSGTPR